MKLLIKGTANEVIEQLFGLKNYYGENAFLTEIIENENKISQCEYKKPYDNYNNLNPIFDNILKGIFIL